MDRPLVFSWHYKVLLWYIFSFRTQQTYFDVEYWGVTFLICTSCIIVGWILDVILRQGLQTLFILIPIILSVMILQQGRMPEGKLRQERYNVVLVTIDNLSKIADVFPTYYDRVYRSPLYILWELLVPLYSMQS